MRPAKKWAGGSWRTSECLRFAADWVADQAAIPKPGQFLSDQQTGDLARLGGMAQVLDLQPCQPEKVQIRILGVNGNALSNFFAVLRPYLRALCTTSLLKVQGDHVVKELLDAGKDNTVTRYENVLAIIGTGWDENRYRFLPSGKLKLRLETACPPTAATR